MTASKYDYTSKDFRNYKPEWVKDRYGNKTLLRICEELIGGRWEPFLSIIKEIRVPRYQNNN